MDKVRDEETGIGLLSWFMGYCAKHGEFNDFVSNGVCPNCEFQNQLWKSIEMNRPVKKDGLRRKWLKLCGYRFNDDLGFTIATKLGLSAVRCKKDGWLKRLWNRIRQKTESPTDNLLKGLTIPLLHSSVFYTIPLSEKLGIKIPKTNWLKRLWKRILHLSN